MTPSPPVASAPVEAASVVVEEKKTEEKKGFWIRIPILPQK
jgi:hypothetical protein